LALVQVLIHDVPQDELVLHPHSAHRCVRLRTPSAYRKASSLQRETRLTDGAFGVRSARAPSRSWWHALESRLRARSPPCSRLLRAASRIAREGSPPHLVDRGCPHARTARADR